jgi:putative FmdB family regulatory protein
MPIYEYKCNVCEHRFSVLQRMGEGNEHLVCEKCGASKPSKQFSTFASGSGSSSGGMVSSTPSRGSGFT